MNVANYRLEGSAEELVELKRAIGLLLPKGMIGLTSNGYVAKINEHDACVVDIIPQKPVDGVIDFQEEDVSRVRRDFQEGSPLRGLSFSYREQNYRIVLD